MKMPLEHPGLFDNMAKELPEELMPEYNEFISDYLNYKDIFNHSEEELVEMNNRIGYYFSKALEKYDVEMTGNARSGGWMVQAQYLSMGQKHDYTSAFDGINIPVQIIHAEDDIVQTEAASKSYIELFEGAHFDTIPNSGHAPFSDQPKLFSEIVEDFLIRQVGN